MSLEPTKHGKNIFESVSSDVNKHILSFLSVCDLAAVGRTHRNSYLMIKRRCLDSVHHIAWIDDNGFHIKPISSAERYRMDKNLWSMTTSDNKQIHSKEYLLESFINHSFDWAMFIRKQHRGVDLDETKGYWKMLPKDYYLINDLDIIKSLVLHKEVAPMLLNYVISEEENPFKDTITVNIHQIDSDKVNKYDISFWNGASPNQCNTFEIHDHQKNRTRFLMNFNSSPSDTYWHWYDNDSSRFKAYNLGPIVNAQIECSFQANLMYNFPLQLQKSGLFNNVNLTMLKREFVKKFSHTGNHNDKVFALRCGFDKKDDPNRTITTMEQLTITTYGFPRSIKRIRYLNGQYKNDFCHFTEDNFDLRMEKYRPFSKVKPRERSNAIH
mmetsp:Transcript_6965/g.6219  ORF Transcript_6965/g.6219 Transcript_6965/m.6219 type:complete len:383 (-) Transcript_6965:90-1238(-)